MGKLLETSLLVVGAWVMTMEGVKNNRTGVLWEAVKDSHWFVYLNCGSVDKVDVNFHCEEYYGAVEIIGIYNQI